MKNNINNFLKFKLSDLCCGCGACVYKCPKKALQLKENKKGFLYPVLDEELCIDCGICKNVCPLTVSDCGHKIDKLYAVMNKDENVLENSQSGGVFSLLSDFILEHGGAVYGAIIDDNLHVRYGRAIDKSNRDKMRMSKYVQCEITIDILKKITEDLNNGLWVLFTGTPCYSYMANKLWGMHDKFISVDFICHGVPSPKIYSMYLDYQEKRIDKGDFITGFIFRNQHFKIEGNHTESIFTKFAKKYQANLFLGIFYSHLAHRESCFSCPFANEKRYSDFTTGGFLDKNYFSNKSKYEVSKLFINSVKAKKLFKLVKNNAYYKRSKIFNKFNNQPCLYNPVKKPELYESFWEDLECMTFQNLTDKYITNEIYKKFYLTIDGNYFNTLKLMSSL